MNQLAEAKSFNSGQALVLSGGGARAAYQVGCLRAIAQKIPGYRLVAGQCRSSRMPLAADAHEQSVSHRAGTHG